MVVEVVAITAEVKTAIFAADKVVRLRPYLRDYGATGSAVRTELDFPHLLAIRWVGTVFLQKQTKLTKV